MHGAWVRAVVEQASGMCAWLTAANILVLKMRLTLEGEAGHSHARQEQLG